MADELKPWERQVGEPTKAFHAFVHYRDMELAERAQSKAFKAHQVVCLKKADDPKRIYSPNKKWQQWKRAWNWEERAAAHDRDVDAEKRRLRIKDIEAMNTRHAQIAQVGLGKVIEGLATLQGATLSPAQIAILADKFSTIQRRALGQATDIVESKEAEKLVDLTKLSDTELDEWERLNRKASGGPEDANAA